MERKTKKIFKWIIWGTIILLIGIGMGFMFYIYSQTKVADKVFAKGVSVENVALGGLTMEQAQQKINQILEQRQKETKVMLFNGTKNVNISFNELGAKHNLDELLKEVFAIGKKENLLERYKISKTGIALTNFELIFTYTQENVYSTIEKHAKDFYIAPKDATIERKNKQFSITKEEAGQQVNLQATTDLVMKGLENTKEYEKVKIEVVMQIALPKYTKAYFANVQTPIASFYTHYNDADPSRNINLKVASGKINKVLAPGEEFSLAKQLEPIDFASGYRASKVIVNGKLEDGIGGGVCQVASTLYNAILLSNLDITVRQNHSLPVAYVPLGRDATYATGIIDFKFKNNSKDIVFIESYCENNRVYVNLFGNALLKPKYDEIKFLSETVEVIAPPAPQYINEPKLEKGKQVQELRPLQGKKVKLYKLYYKNGQMVKKEFIDQSYYRPRGEVIKVGIKELASALKDIPVIKPTPTPSATPNLEIPVEEWPSINLEDNDTTDNLYIPQS